MMRSGVQKPRWRALVVCTHLRPGRIKRKSRYVMQPITGLHIASLIDQRYFNITLHHEDWHGPFDVGRSGTYDIVFLTGLQPDFDRMRQLSFYFRRSGAKVIAGGSICTAFPEFATEFFDAVCAGGVDVVRDVIKDFVEGRLKSIYRSPTKSISDYRLDYSLFARNGINPNVHLMEASRGCEFRCTFCVIPNEVGGHATYSLARLSETIMDALITSPRFSFRRIYPTIIFLDNNFSDNREHMLAVCKMLKAHKSIRGWAALVTQNVIHDRELIVELANSKCMTLFVGIESLDREFLKKYKKTQNLSKSRNVIEDIEFAESKGIGIGYGYLFDPRFQSAAEMEGQLRVIERNPHLPMPVYLSLVAPLAGTQAFWEDLRTNQLRPNLRLRDLDGETIAYRSLADDPNLIVSFLERLFRRPWTIVSRFSIAMKTIRRIARCGSWDPVRWYIIAAANLHCFVWSNTEASQARTYLAGTEVLDPQYSEIPMGISTEEFRRYFAPIALTDDTGAPMEWLSPYVPSMDKRPVRIPAGAQHLL